MSRPVLVEIVEQHAEEAAFLWILRNQATRAPNQDLTSLAELDERIDAHLDGLRVAGARGWDICLEQLAWREAGEVFAAAHVALLSRIGKRFDLVLETATVSVDLAGGLVGALAWLPYQEVERTVHALLASSDPLVKRIGVAASAAHRRDPGPTLGAAALDQHPSLRARALKAAAELGRRDLSPSSVYHPDVLTVETEFWYAWSAALLGCDSTEILRRIALAEGAFANSACDLATRCMSHNDALVWHRELAGAERFRLAIVAAGAIGDPALVPWLIDVMPLASHARAAGEAFSVITGVDLAGDGLAAPRPDDFESGPNDDPNDDNVAIDPDEHLPWPHPRALAHWWTANHAAFASGTRYLTGRAVDARLLHRALVTGRQRQRAAAALELVLRAPGQPLFAVNARADRQLDALRSRGALH